MRAKYAFAGAKAELERTAPLDPDEDVLLHGAMRLRGVGLMPRPVVLRLTAQRISVLAHYAFRSDRRGFRRECQRATCASPVGDTRLVLRCTTP
jgi:hypothetical protein